MGKEFKLYKSKEQKSRNEVSDQLHMIADKIKAGELFLQSGNNQVSLGFSEELTLEIEAEDKQKKYGTRHCLQIEIKWYDSKDPQPLQINDD